MKEEVQVDIDKLSVSDEIIKDIGEIIAEKADNIFAVAYLIDSNGDLISEQSIVFNYPKKLNLLKPDIKVETEANNDGVEISLKSNVFVHRLMLDLPDNILHFSDNFFNITSSDVVKVNVKTELSKEYIKDNLILKSAYDVKTQK